MTQVGKMLLDEGRQEGDIARAKKTALNMLKKGVPIQEVVEILELPEGTIRTWEEEACAVIGWPGKGQTERGR